MFDLKQLLVALGHDPHKPISRSNPYGTGYLIHLGLEVKCAGALDADGNSVPDSKHLIGTLTAVPDAGAEVVPTERADEATFDAAQTDFDLANPVCTVCGAKVSI